MTVLSQTPANVALGGTDTRFVKRQCGEGITQGMPYYLHTDGKCYQSDANGSVTTGKATGIALTPAATDGYFVGAESGPVIVGGTMVVGQLYGTSATKGAIDLVSVFTTGDYPTVLGGAISATVLQLDIQNVGVVRP